MSFSTVQCQIDCFKVISRLFTRLLSHKVTNETWWFQDNLYHHYSQVLSLSVCESVQTSVSMYMIL